MMVSDLREGLCGKLRVASMRKEETGRWTDFGWWVSLLSAGVK